MHIVLVELATGLGATGEFPWDGESDPTGLIELREPVVTSRWHGYRARDLEHKGSTASGVGWHWFGITVGPEDPERSTRRSTSRQTLLAPT